MKLPRKYRPLTALIALVGMLFMQLAIASYACPARSTSGETAVTTGDQVPAQSMPCCDQPDPDNVALCQAHCQDAKTSLDKPQVPPVAPAAVIVSAILAPLDPRIPVVVPDGGPRSSLQRATAPPIAIRHCCFRI